jgi:hypothetical protein
MQTTLIERFAPTIRSLSDAELTGMPSLRSKLRLAQDGDIEVCYCPSEYINSRARLVLVGITPGKTQWLNALREARKQLRLGNDHSRVIQAAKQVGAFSGAMRSGLVDLLDHIGINRWLGIPNCSELFGQSSHLVQTTSVLRNAVFLAGDNYNGTPNILRHALLREQLMTYFVEDARTLSNAVFVPLGPRVTEALRFLADEGLIDRKTVLAGLPHSSGANAERIAYFLGRKNRAQLSIKTAPDKLDLARENLLRQVAALR